MLLRANAEESSESTVKVLKSTIQVEDLYKDISGAKLEGMGSHLNVTSITLCIRFNFKVSVCEFKGINLN